VFDNQFINYEVLFSYNSTDDFYHALLETQETKAIEYVERIRIIDIVDYAIRRELLVVLDRYLGPHNNIYIRTAASYGKATVFFHLIRKDSPHLYTDTFIMHLALKGGNLKILEWLIDNGAPYKRIWVYEYILFHDKSDILRLWVQKGLHVDEKEGILINMSLKMRSNLTHLLIEMGANVNLILESTFEDIVSNNDLSSIVYLHKSGVKLPLEKMLNKAIRLNLMDISIYLYIVGDGIYNRETVDNIMKNGYLSDALAAMRDSKLLSGSYINNTRLNR
jgi:hypothetical protein